MKISKLGIVIGLISLVVTNFLVTPVFIYAASNSVIVGQPSNTGVEPEFHGGSGFDPDFNAPVIGNLNVTTSSNSATINWVTDELATYRVIYGTTTEYLSGSIAKDRYATTHSALVSDLAPNTTYYFSVRAIDQSGNESVYTGVFITLVPPDTEAPSNVSEFIALPQINKIQLTWNNSPEPDFSYVRIIKSEKFFPTDPLNGEVIYQGKGTSFIDTNVVPGVIYFYAAFAKDYAGNYSSGSVAYTMIPSSDDLNKDPNAPTVDIQLPFVSTPPQLPIPFHDFLVSDNQGSQISLEDSEIPVGQSLEIAIPKEKLPNDGAFLTLTVSDEGKKNTPSTYLFAYDEVNENYKVKTPAFKTVKRYSLVVTVFSSSKLIIEKVIGKVEVVKEAKASDGSSGGSGGLPAGIIIGTAILASVLVTVHFWRLVRIKKKMSAKSGGNKNDI